MNPPLAWILGGGLAMSALALVGGTVALLPRRVLDRWLLVLVSLAAGSMLGGALFHMLPEAVARSSDTDEPFAWVALGFVSMFCLEQFMHWHHCHRAPDAHRATVGYLVLIADGVHNFVGGLAVASAFLADIRVGITAWLAAAAHEIPQELGDFGVLVHGGWSKKRALAFNFLSALSFPLGGVVAYGAAAHFDVGFLLPFAAGNFLYIAAADLIPEINQRAPLTRRLELLAAFGMGLGTLWLLRLTFHP